MDYFKSKRHSAKLNQKLLFHVLSIFGSVPHLLCVELFVQSLMPERVLCCVVSLSLLNPSWLTLHLLLYSRWHLSLVFIIRYNIFPGTSKSDMCGQFCAQCEDCVSLGISVSKYGFLPPVGKVTTT